MKRNLSNLFRISAFLIVAVIVMSCGERNRLPNNYFKVGENVYELKTGSIIYKGELEGKYLVDMRLYCENGTDFINFGILSSQAEAIDCKTYTFMDGMVEGLLNGSWVLGYTENGSYTNMANIYEGEVVVDRSPQGYTIEINCIDQYSNEVKGVFKGELTRANENNFVYELPKYVLPTEIYEAVTTYIPIYSGVTPPDMSGEYVSSPHTLIYESYSENPDSIQVYSDRYMAFIYNQKQLNFYGKQYDPNINDDNEESHPGIKITGENGYFTCYYIVDGYPGGYYAQQSFIFSGKKTDLGIEDFHTAVVLLETSGNPDMYEKNSFRVLKDADGLAENKNWLSKRNGTTAKNVSDKELFKMWMK
jgi:hypothetical protein